MPWTTLFLARSLLPAAAKNGPKQLQLFLCSSRTPRFTFKAKIIQTLEKLNAPFTSTNILCKKITSPSWVWVKRVQKWSKLSQGWPQSGKSRRSPSRAAWQLKWRNVRAGPGLPQGWGVAVAVSCSLHQFSALISFHCLIKLITQATESSQASPSQACLQALAFLCLRHT